MSCMRWAPESFLLPTAGYMTMPSADILSCTPDGFIANVVGQQGLSWRPHEQVLKTGLDSRF